MTSESRRGTAYHEAGHAIVAWALSVRVAKVEIGTADQGYPGGTHTYPLPEGGLSLRDQLAIWLGGKAAERLFDAPTHGRAWFIDRYYADKLVEHLDDETQSALKHEGWERATELLVAHKRRAAQVAEYLIKHGKIDDAGGLDLLPPTAPTDAA